MDYVRRWIREYELVFAWENGSLGITSVGQKDPLNIAFEITYDPKQMGMGTMELKVQGLKESNIALLTRLGVKVFFSVGYKGYALTRIFTGELRKLTVESDSNKHETKMVFTTSRLSSKPFIRNFKSGVKHHERIQEMIEEMGKDHPGLVTDIAIKELDNLIASEPPRASLRRRALEQRTLLTDEVDGPLTTQDTALDELESYLKTFAIETTVHNDTLYLVRKGGTFPIVSTTRLILGDSLISPPRRRLDNTEGASMSASANMLFEMTALLEPSILPNSVVISSHVRNDLGNVEEREITFKVVELKHSGEYRGKTWYTTVACSTDDTYLIPSPIVSVSEEIKNGYKEPAYVPLEELAKDKNAVLDQRFYNAVTRGSRR